MKRVTEGASEERQAPQQDERRETARGGDHPAVLVLLWCLLGLLVPRALLYTQLAPWGVSLAAATGGLPVTAAVLVGYLLAGEVLFPLRYMAAVGVVAGGHWVLAALPELKGRLIVPPLLAFCATAITGLVMLGQYGLDGWRVLLILAESAVAAAGALFFRVTVDYAKASAGGGSPLLTPGRQAAVIFTGAVAVMAAAGLTLGGFSFGRMAAALLVLVLGRSGREAGGCMAGVILGAAMALVDPAQTAAAMALAIGGLVAGIFSRFGRLAEAATFFTVAAVMLLGRTEEDALLRIYELAAACLLVVVLPKSWDRRLAHLFIQSRELPATEGLRRGMTVQLAVAAKAMTEVGDTVAAVSGRLARHGAPDTAALLRDCCGAVCEGCPLQALCWEENREETVAALEATLPVLRRQGAVTPPELTGHLSRQCRRREQLTGYLTRGFAAMLAREGAWQRLDELQSAVHGQLAATGELLAGLSRQLQQPGQVDVELSGRVLTVCRDHGLTVLDALCSRGPGNRLAVDILIEGDYTPPTDGRWMREICGVCDRQFAPPAVTEWENARRLTLTEQPRYRVEMGVACHCCDGEKLCGDAVHHITFGGQTVVLLSDGMGSGGRAAVDGAMTVGLAARLWQAGFGPEGILQTVNAALMVKSREESLATLDVAVIDEFSGGLELYKAGAVASLLLSGGRVSRLERTGLPLGILREARFERGRDRLAPGDVVVMMSDGALAEGMAAVEQQLAACAPEESMQTLARRVADAAKAAGAEHPDDITVVALRLHRAEA